MSDDERPTIGDNAIPGVHIETLHNPIRYTHAQIEGAVHVASFMGRGKFVLCSQPEGEDA